MGDLLMTRKKAKEDQSLLLKVKRFQQRAALRRITPFARAAFVWPDFMHQHLLCNYTFAIIHLSPEVWSLFTDTWLDRSLCLQAILWLFSELDAGSHTPLNPGPEKLVLRRALNWASFLQARVSARRDTRKDSRDTASFTSNVYSIDYRIIH